MAENQNKKKEKEEEPPYKRRLSQYIVELIPEDEIKFVDVIFEVVERQKKRSIQELEAIGVFDPNHYRKNELLKITSQFIQQYDFQGFQSLIFEIKKQKFLPQVYASKYKGPIEVCQELYEPLVKFMLERQNNKKLVRFKWINDEHVQFFSKLMKNPNTINLTIGQKRKRMQREFPHLQISDCTVWKIQKKLLNYSFKRICQYVPKRIGNKLLRRIAFIQKFLFYIQDDTTELFIMDEMGIGSNPLRRYGYSKIGQPAVLQRNQLLRCNLTCSATISVHGLEFIQFQYGKGTRKEGYREYFKTLISYLNQKYPEKKHVYILDNLPSHKSHLIMKIIRDNDTDISVLYTPSNTPEFSPIENMFGCVKRKLKDVEFRSYTRKKECKIAFLVMDTIHSIEQYAFEGFFRRTLNNMIQFWLKLDREKLLSQIENLDQ